MSSPSTATDTALRIGVILLTLVTALIHLQLNFPDPVFILSGLGYLALLAALYLPFSQLDDRRYTIRWALVGYTAMTIFLWILFGARTPIGYIDKLIEVALILLLLVESRRSL